MIRIADQSSQLAVEEDILDSMLRKATSKFGGDTKKRTFECKSINEVRALKKDQYYSPLFKDMSEEMTLQMYESPRYKQHSP